MADVAMPVPCADSITLEGVTIDIQTSPQRNRYNLWVDSLQAILGGLQIVSGIHVWMADTPSFEARASWSRSLREMLARHPSHALPGHMTAGSPVGVEAIQFTLGYIETFNRELPKAKDGAGLIGAMRCIYPNLALEFVLELGAKVCKGEIAWP